MNSYFVQGTKYKVGIRIGIDVLVFKDLSCLPLAGYIVLGTSYNF